MPTPNDYLMHGSDAEQYYAQTQEKHFSESATGSVFDDPRAPTLNDLLELAIEQYGSLDDRDHEFPKDPSRPGVYYVSVQVEGKTGVVCASDLSLGEAVLVKVSKEGVPPDYVVFGRPRQATHSATLVMAAEMSMGQPTGRKVLITCHPGPPAARAGEHRLSLQENTVLSREEMLPEETILIGDLNVLGSYTEEVIEGMLGHPIVDGSDVNRVLSAIAAADSSVRAEAQDVLHEAARLDDGYYDFGSDAMAAMLERRVCLLREQLVLASVDRERSMSVSRPNWAASRKPGRDVSRGGRAF